MKFKAYQVMLLAIALLFISAAHRSITCDCIMYPVESYMNKVDYIFTGKVIEILDANKEKNKNNGYEARVVILEKLKCIGIKSDTLDFTSDSSNCDPSYELSQSYLFFANKVENNKFKMAHCTYWGSVAESKKIFKRLKRNLKDSNKWSYKFSC